MDDKILYILDYYLPHCGGVETVFEQIITRTLSKGKKVIILTSQFDKGLPTYEKNSNLEIYRVGSGRLSFFLMAFIRGVQLLSKENIKFIHTSTYTGAIPAALLARYFGKKILLTVHEVFAQLWYQYKPWRSAWIYHLFERMIFQMPIDIFHCVSRYTLNAVRLIYGISDHKLKLIYNGVDQDFWSPSLVSQAEKNQISEHFSLSGYRNLLYFGHTGKSKGIDFLIKAIPSLLQTHPDLQIILNFIPSKRQSHILQMLTEQLSILPSDQSVRVRIHYGLAKTQLRALVATVDAVIAPSLSEGFGSVHSEVCAMHTPLITTNISAIPEVVSGSTVLIAPSSVAEILNGVKKIKKADFSPLATPEFDWQKQYDQLWQLYQSFFA